MNNMKDNDDRESRLDKILDASLASYTDVEPRAGLEERILANLRTQPEAAQSGLWNWKWMLAGGAALAALVLMAIMLSPWGSQSQPRGSQVARNVPAVKNAARTRKDSEPAPTVASASPAKVLRAGRPNVRAVRSNAAASGQSAQRLAAVPHQAVFPSPTGPSEQERMLLSYVKRTPPEILIAMSAEQQQREQEWLEETDRTQKSAKKSGSL